MLKTPLQGFRQIVTIPLISFLVIGAIAAPNALAAEMDQEANLREIDGTLIKISENVDRINRIFAANQSSLSVSGSMREIVDAVNEMDKASDQMQRVYSAFTNNTQHESTIKDFIAALEKLGQSAREIQRLLRPIGIRPAQNNINLRDVIFALNNIVDGAQKLKRILNSTINHYPGDPGDPPGEPADIPEVALDDLVRTFRHVVTSAHKVQTLSHQIDPNTTARPEVIKEVATLLGETSDWILRFERLLKAYGPDVEQGHQVIRKMIKISGQVQQELNRLIHAILLSDRIADVASGDVLNLRQLNAGLSHIIGELRSLRRGLKSLAGDSPTTEPVGDPANINPIDSSLQRFDLNGNCVIDNDEIIHALELWISKQLDKAAFMKIIDLWVSATPVCEEESVSSESTSSSVIKLKTRLDSRGAIFHTQGQDVESTKLEIFNSAGKRIISQQTDGAKLMWNLRNKNGQNVANGVYFYIVSNELIDGTLWRSEINKLIVLR